MSTPLERKPPVSRAENLGRATPQSGTERAPAASLPTHRRRALGPGLRLSEAVND